MNQSFYAQYLEFINFVTPMEMRHISDVVRSLPNFSYVGRQVYYRYIDLAVEIWWHTVVQQYSSILIMIYVFIASCLYVDW